MRYFLLMATAAMLLAGIERTTPEQMRFPCDDNRNYGRTFATEPEALQGKKLFDSFKSLSSNDEKARLDHFAIELQTNPNTTGYIIVYGRRNRPGEAKKRADRAKQYLLYYRRMGRERLVSLDHCFRTQLEVELWIVPRGAAPPVPCATGKAKAK
jgi:hypothetical protein